MAKAQTKRKATKAQPTKQQAPSAPVTLPGLDNGHDIDPRANMNHANAANGGFDYKSESENKLEQTFEQAKENADLVGAAWKERVKKEGKIYYTCPICPGGPNNCFKDNNPKKAFKACQDHIKKQHPMRVQELKLVKADKSLYTPMQKVESPKRTLADVVHPKYRAQVEANLRTAAALKPLREQAERVRTNGNAVMKIVAMTESLAVQQVPKLDDKSLVEVYHLATNRGRRLLARAAKQACDAKGINVFAPKQRSGKAQAIQEALLASAFAAQNR